MYYKFVGRNSTLILGVTPDTNGLVPEAAMTTLKEFGVEITSRFDHPVASTSGKGKKLILALSVVGEVIPKPTFKSG